MVVAVSIKGEEMENTNGKLTLSDAIALGVIADASSRGAKVARLIDGNVYYGTARSIGTDTGHADFDHDVRNQYLRVTLNMGFETFWIISDLIPEVITGEFVVDFIE